MENKIITVETLRYYTEKQLYQYIDTVYPNQATPLPSSTVAAGEYWCWINMGGESSANILSLTAQLPLDIDMESFPISLKLGGSVLTILDKNGIQQAVHAWGEINPTNLTFTLKMETSAGSTDIADGAEAVVFWRPLLAVWP